MSTVNPPIDTPPQLYTAKTDTGAGGVPMSKRMNALYHFIQTNGVNLHSWSTDECVKREAKRLRNLWNWLEARANPKWATIQRDIETLLNRVPQNRIV